LQITSRKQQARRFDRWRGVSSLACLDACGGPGRLPLQALPRIFDLLFYNMRMQFSNDLRIKAL